MCEIHVRVTIRKYSCTEKVTLIYYVLALRLSV